ncbi:MAG: hypothetical protein AAF567_24755 [Actinomycetota bacterium]
MELRPGLKLKSAVCATEVIVVGGSGDVDVTCGGVSMVEATAEAPEATAVDGMTEGTLLGKRYTDGDATVEVLCTKPGDGSLGIGATAMGLKEATALPASD